MSQLNQPVYYFSKKQIIEYYNEVSGQYCIAFRDSI